MSLDKQRTALSKRLNDTRAQIALSEYNLTRYRDHEKSLEAELKGLEAAAVLMAEQDAELTRLSDQIAGLTKLVEAKFNEPEAQGNN